jgi:hypothetical protein
MSAIFRYIDNKDYQARICGEAILFLAKRAADHGRFARARRIPSLNFFLKCRNQTGVLQRQTRPEMALQKGPPS